MKNVKKIVLFSFMFLFVFAFTFGLANRTEAASGCSAVASGDWSVGAIWNCDVGGARVPTADDAVYITNYVVTIPTGYAAEALSVGINNDSAPAGITIAGSGTLSSSQNVVLGAPAGGINNTLSVGTGILIVKDGLVITGGGALGASEVTVSTGTIHVDNSVSFVGDMSTAKLTSTGTSSIYVGGNFGLTNMGTFDGTGSTLFLDGATSQILGASTGYNHVYVANTSGGVILSPGTTTINGTLQIFYSLGSTAFDIADADLTVLGATSIGADASLIVSSTTGTKTFTGDVDVLTGGYWNEQVAEDISFGGNFINNGTLIALAGNHTFTGLLKSIGGTTTNKFSNLIIDGTISNIGDLTVSTALTGAGILTNTNNCTLDIKGTISADIVATAPGNIVLYSKNGDQTVRTEDYVNLYLVGSGIKTISAGLDIAGDLYVANGVTADLTGDSTVNRLAIVSQTPVVPGVWGAVGSVNPLVDHESASITGAGSITVPDITPPTVAITMSDYDLTVGETATITFTFSEAPVDFGDTDVTVENGTISSVVATGDPLVFTATFTPTAGISDTTNIVTVGKDWTDVASNPPAVTTVSANYTINTIRARTTSTGSYAAGHTPSYIATPTVTPTTTSTSTLFVFTKLLKYSMINNDVKELQKFLNTHGYQIAITGAGSPGHETNYFGTLTKKAVIKFQLANKLVGDGIIGPKTNAVINSLNK